MGENKFVRCYFDNKLVREIRIDKILFIENKEGVIQVYYEDSMGLDDVYEVDCTKIDFR